jgi:hypothetical protein
MKKPNHKIHWREWPAYIVWLVKQFGKSLKFGG